MKKIIDGLKYWGQLLLLPIYWLSFLVPRNKRIWLFGSTFGRRFADNPRYLYLYVNHMVKQEQNDICKIGNKNIRPIWISHNKEIVAFLNENGYGAYTYHSLKGIWYALIGGVYFYDNYSKDINFWQSGGALKVNLWHGVGNKCINFDNIHDKVRHPKNAWERFKFFPRRLSDEKPTDYILTTSPMMSNIFSRAFQVPMEHIVETGYPRNDILFEDCAFSNLHNDQEKKVQEDIEQFKNAGCKLLTYVPTFRPSEKKFLDIMDLEKFNAFLKSHDMVLICKLHPKSKFASEFEVMNYSNIYVVPADVDINSFLGRIDLMIADYSSVYSDYKLLDRPVVAFHYDFAEYSSDTRDAYFDWDEYMPEVKATTMEELERAILKVLSWDEKRKERMDSRNKMYTYADCKSCERTARKVLELL